MDCGKVSASACNMDFPTMERTTHYLTGELQSSSCSGWLWLPKSTGICFNNLASVMFQSWSLIMMMLFVSVTTFPLLLEKSETLSLWRYFQMLQFFLTFLGALLNDNHFQSHQDHRQHFLFNNPSDDIQSAQWLRPQRPPSSLPSASSWLVRNFHNSNFHNFSSLTNLYIFGRLTFQVYKWEVSNLRFPISLPSGQNWDYSKMMLFFSFVWSDTLLSPQIQFLLPRQMLDFEITHFQFHRILSHRSSAWKWFSFCCRHSKYSNICRFERILVKMCEQQQGDWRARKSILNWRNFSTGIFSLQFIKFIVNVGTWTSLELIYNFNL